MSKTILYSAIGVIAILFLIIGSCAMRGCSRPMPQESYQQPVYQQPVQQPVVV